MKPTTRPRLLIDGLSMLDASLGSPRWFWPAVMFTLFIVLQLAQSALEVAQ